MQDKIKAHKQHSPASSLWVAILQVCYNAVMHIFLLFTQEMETDSIQCV